MSNAADDKLYPELPALGGCHRYETDLDEAL
jgi:hypothetical protein